MSQIDNATPAGQSGDIDLGEITLTLRRRWRWVAATTALVAGAAVLYVLLATPRFALTGSLYLGDARPSAPVGQADSGLNFLSDFQAVSDINTQVELIKAKGLVEQAILESGFNAALAPVGAPALRYWRWGLLRHRNVGAFAPRPGDLRAVDARVANAPSAALHFIVTMGDGGSYRVDEAGGWGHAGRTLLIGQLGKPASGGGLSLLLKPAVDGVAPPAGARFSMSITSAEALQDRLQRSGQLTVLAGGLAASPTKIANLQLLAANPYAGRLFLNQLMGDFITTQVSWNNQAASTTQAFITQQLAGIKTALSKADRDLAAYQAQTGIIDVPENAKAVIGQLSQYETQRTALQLQQEALRQLQTEISRPSGTLNPYLLSQTGDSVLGQLATSLSAEETKLETLQSQFTTGAPDVLVQQAAVNRIEESIRSVVGNELAISGSSLAYLNQMIGQFNGQLRAMPAQSLKVIALNRASDVYGQIYVLLMQKEQEAEVSKAASIVDTRVVTPAEIPLKASSPKVVITLVLGVLLGMFAGAAYVLGQRSLSKQFQSEEELRRLVKLPVYGVIPRRPESEGGGNILIAHPQTAFAEALRMLRSNIQRSGAPQQSRVLLLTSSGVDDGKTTIAVNLAKILADGGKRVVLVDADLHVGRIHEMLKTDPVSGLTEALATLTKPVVQAVPGQRFLMVAAGVLPPNPSELINEAYLANVVAGLKAEFDYVVIDSPPVPAVADALVLGELADLILSVAMIGHTSRTVFAVHGEMVAALNGRHGLIINGVAGNAYGYGYGAKARPQGIARIFRRAPEHV